MKLDCDFSSGLVSKVEINTYELREIMKKYLTTISLTTHSDVEVTIVTRWPGTDRGYSVKSTRYGEDFRGKAVKREKAKTVRRMK
jgi:SHS2 domain-containing protein